MKKKWLVVLSTILLFCVMVFPAAAAQNGQTQGYSITVRAAFNRIAIRNAEFRLYRVGEGADRNYAYLPPYDSLGLPAYSDTVSAAKRTVIIAGLQAYIEKNNPKPDATARTDRSGNATFSGLQAGVYLVLSDEQRTFGNVIYTPLPILIHLPYTQNGAAADHVEADIKYAISVPTTEPPAGTTTPPGSTTPPPGSTTEPPTGETTEPPTGETTEPPTGETTEPPTGETTEPPTGETTEPPTGETTEPPTGETTEPPTASTTEPTTKPDKPQIPPTGQLWWPVPVLLAAGLLLTAFGLGLRRKTERDK